MVKALSKAAAKLLKKQDACRAIYLASHLFWGPPEARPAQTPFFLSASRSVRRAHLKPQVHAGSLYRYGKEHLRAACRRRSSPEHCA